MFFRRTASAPALEGEDRPGGVSFLDEDGEVGLDRGRRPGAAGAVDRLEGEPLPAAVGDDEVDPFRGAEEGKDRVLRLGDEALRLDRLQEILGDEADLGILGGDQDAERKVHGSLNGREHNEQQAAAGQMSPR